MFTLGYTGIARQRLMHLHPLLKQDMRAALDGLRENPWLGKPLQKELTGLRSLRVRTHRLLYVVEEERRRIAVILLGPRRTIYEDVSKLRRTIGA